MTAAQFEEEVRARHAAGASPKEIARALGVRPAGVIPIVRRAATERPAAPNQATVRGCWVSPGWSVRLSVDKNRDWPDDPEANGVGLVTLVDRLRGQDLADGVLADLCLVALGLNDQTQRAAGEDQIASVVADHPGGFHVVAEVGEELRQEVLELVA